MELLLEHYQINALWVLLHLKPILDLYLKQIIATLTVRRLEMDVEAPNTQEEIEKTVEE